MKRREYTISTNTGPETVLGYPAGPDFFTHCFAAKSWILTHRGTGLRAAKLHSREAAQRLGKALTAGLPLGFWDKVTEKPELAGRADVVAQVRVILADAGIQHGRARHEQTTPEPDPFAGLNSKLDRLAELEGESASALVEAGTFDSVAAAICTRPGCDYTTTMEPDQREGWCEECGTGTVVSAPVLAGVI